MPLRTHRIRAQVAALCAKLEELGVDSAAVLESVAEGGDDLT